MKSFIAIAAIASLSFVAIASTALAGSRAGGCTKEPQAKWLKAEMVEMKAKEAGYAVAKSKVTGTCYEVYTTKAGKKFELFYNPVTMELVETVAK